MQHKFLMVKAFFLLNKEECQMEIISLCSMLVLTGALASAHLVGAQDDPTGFISLDCGRPLKDTPYAVNSTGITYISDSSFINGGESRSINPEYRKDWQVPLWYLRSFPDGDRNCYNLKVTAGQKYLIRASFVYGNYDDKNELPEFDLYIGSNLWASVDIFEVDAWIFSELVHVPSSNNLQVCLVKSGKTVPFISVLELRPLTDEIYDASGGSLLRIRRWYLSTSVFRVSYPDDVYDRFWLPKFNNRRWKEISTEIPVKTNSAYQPPQSVMKTAATSIDHSLPLRISWTDSRESSRYYVYLYMAEIELLEANELREFNILLNGRPRYGPFSPLNHTLLTIFTSGGWHSATGRYEILFERTKNSTRPPLLNAIEIYRLLPF